MKIWENKTNKYFVILLISLMAIELIFKAVMGLDIMDWSTVRILVGINFMALGLGILLSFNKRVIGNIFTTLIVAFSTIYAIAQAGFYNYIGTYMSLGTSSQAGAVTDYIVDYFSSFKIQYWLLLLPFILLCFYWIFGEWKFKISSLNKQINFIGEIKGKKAKEEFDKLEKKRIHRQNFRIRILALVGFIGLGFLYYGTLVWPFMQNSIQIASNIELFRNPSLPSIAVNQFGINGFGILDVSTIIIPAPQEAEQTFKKAETQEITDYSRIIDDTAWEKVSEEETDSDYKTLNSYFMSKEITSKNEATGLFAGKNLIVIQMESVNEIFINQEYFPTLYKMYTQGWSWNNAFSPRNSCSTGNNEMSAMVSLFTINRSCTANNYRNNTYFESIFNLFNNEDYNSTSYHDYTDKYYYRHTIHINMGSSKFYGVKDLGIPYDEAYEEWPSDVLLMEKALPNFINNDHFLAYLTTVTSHQPYYLSSEMGDKYLDYFSTTDYPTTLKRYLSKLKELDNALARLLELLQENGKLDDTVIVLYSDHYPYGLESGVIQEALDYDITKYGNIDRTPFVIYNSTLTPTVYNQYTSYMNILPTLANLFDLDYDPRLYAGHDLLSADYPNYVVFADGSWQSDIAYYSASTGRITYYGDEKYTSDEIQEINKRIRNEIKMDNLAIQTNYFEYLGKAINKYVAVDQSKIVSEEEVVEDGEG